MDALNTILVPLHRESYRFVAIAVAVTILLFLFSETLGWIGVGLSLWCAYFFRDPPRVVPTRAGLVLSPADGRVQSVTEAPPPPELDMGVEPRPRIAIFMNVFDVHVNRVPADGEVTKVVYRPGRFLNASLDKSSEDNERQAVRLMTTEGRDIAFVQIAGLVARRILCQLYEGQSVRAGERFGMIRFGSRLDVYLEPGMAPLVAVGQLAVAGETVIADARSEERQRLGEVR